jgi:hypothetical protein
MVFWLTLLNQNSPLETVIDLTGVDVDIVVHDMNKHGVGEQMVFDGVLGSEVEIIDA